MCGLSLTEVVVTIRSVPVGGGPQTKNQRVVS